MLADRLDAVLAPMGAWVTPRRVRAHAVVAAVSIWLAVAVHYAVPAMHPTPDDRIAGDYYYFYVLGSLAGQGQGAMLYDEAAQTAECHRLLDGIVGPCVIPPTFYGPQAALALAPLARLPYWWSVVAWLLGTTLIYFACCHVMWRVCPRLRQERATILALALAYPAFIFLVTFGQTSAPALALFVLAYLALRSKALFLAGLAIGSLAFKPQLGIAAAVVFIAAREWRIVGGALLGVAAQLGVGWARFGTRVVTAYVETILDVGNQFSRFEPKPYHMHSLRAFFSMLLPWWPTAVLVLCVASSGIVLFWTVRTWQRKGPLALRFSLLLLATILVDPHLHAYDLVVLAPALMLIADWTIGHAGGPTAATLKALVYLCYALPLIGPLAILTHVQVSVPAFVALAYTVDRLARSQPVDVPA